MSDEIAYATITDSVTYSRASLIPLEALQRAVAKKLERALPSGDLCRALMVMRLVVDEAVTEETERLITEARAHPRK